MLYRILKKSAAACVFVAMCVVIILGYVPDARAQNCDFAYEVISQLRQPAMGAHNLWDTVYGDLDRHEAVKDALPIPASDNVLMLAERDHADKVGRAIILAEIDRRGRPVWQQIHAVADLDRVEKLMIHQEHYVVLGNLRDGDKRRHIWLGFFNKDGGLDKEYRISSNSADIEATDFVLAHGGQAILLSAVRVNRDGKMPASTMLKWFDLQKRVVTKNVTFAIGVENRVYSLARNGDDRYFMAGSIREKDGRWSGWLGVIDRDGGFVWQRNLARGLGGRFYSVAPFGDRYVVAAGEALPIGDDTKKAAWVLVADAMSADVAWQRYYRDDYNLGAVDVEAYDDGQIAVLINAFGADSGDENKAFDYTRIVMLNPRGAVLDAQGFFNAAGSGAYGFVTGASRERIIFGYTDVAFFADKEKMGDENRVLTNRQAWMVAGSPADIYRDPCKRTGAILQ